MRTAFANTLVNLATTDERIFLLMGDLGYGVLDEFADRFPRRFINAGVAEQNMTGVAAGLALSGKIVFTYSIANFPTIRCLEQIRNDVCYHNANVKVVSVGAGLAYGTLGATHHGTEDIALLRSLPNMTVVVPADPIEAGLATRAIHAKEGPCYLRLGRSGEPTIHKSEPDFVIGKAIEVRQGEDLSLIATGGIVHNAMSAAAALAEQGLSVRVLSMHTIRPIDVDSIRNAAVETGRIVTIEEHGQIGGLGSAVEEVLVEHTDCRVAFQKLTLGNTFCHAVGSQEYLREECSLSVKDIVKAAWNVLEGSHLKANQC